MRQCGETTKQRSALDAHSEPGSNKRQEHSRRQREVIEEVGMYISDGYASYMVGRMSCKSRTDGVDGARMGKVKRGMRQWQDTHELDRKTIKPCTDELIEMADTLRNAKRLVFKARPSLLRAAIQQVQRRRPQLQLDPLTTLNILVAAVTVSHRDRHHIRLQYDETHSRARAQLALIPEPAQRART